MSGRSQPTPGDWQYHPSQSRAIVSDTGETICKVHRGKKAQHNGPILAAALDAIFALVMLLGVVKRMRNGEDVPELQEAIDRAERVVMKAKGETE